MSAQFGQVLPAPFDPAYRFHPVCESLPSLVDDGHLVARFEPVRDKESGALVIKGWWWEDGVCPSDRMQAELARCFRRFLRYLGAEELRVGRELADSADLGWLL